MIGLFSWLEAWLGCTRENRFKAINAPVVPPMPVPASAVANGLVPQVPRTSRYEQSPDFMSVGDTARTVDLVIMHCTEGALPGAIAWLTAKDATPVSAHYAVGKAGDLVQMVGENDIAYHAAGTKEKPSSWRGAGNINRRSIGIEIENKNNGLDPYTPTQLAVCLWLVLRICRRFNLTAEQIIGHDDVDPGRKTDPLNFPWVAFRIAISLNLNRPGGIT